jgi:hypothetical protein
MFLSKKKSESRSKRKDKAVRSLDEKEHHPAFEASRIFFINNKQDARWQDEKSRIFSLPFLIIFFPARNPPQ